MVMGPRIGLRVFYLAAVVAGVAATGANPAPLSGGGKADETAAAITKIFPTPQLYHIVVTGSLPSQPDPGDMCIGVGPLTDMIAKLSDDPAARAALSKGCTQANKRNDDGTFRMDMNCDKAAGAASTSRFSLFGTAKDMHQHMELTMDLGSGQPNTFVTDTHMTHVGDCPSVMKPGQFRKANGEIIDPMADLAKLAEDAKTKKDSQASAQVIPDWRRRATGEDLMRVYPHSAAHRGVEGMAMVVCSVTKEGEMADCAVEQEAPTGEGFGAAALKLMPKFRMRPKTSEGVPVDGGVARIPIQFRLPR
jgi:TonB family protein